MKCRDFGTYRAIKEVRDLLTKGKLYHSCYVKIACKKWGDNENSRKLVVKTDDGVTRSINLYYFEEVAVTNDLV